MRQFSGLIRPGFQETEKAWTNQGPQWGPSPLLQPSHITWALVPPTPLASAGSQVERSYTTSWLLNLRVSKVKEKVPDMPGPPGRGCQLFCSPDWQYTMPSVMAAGASRLVRGCKELEKGQK